MNNYQVYLDQLKQIALQVYSNQLFEQLVVVLTICFFFFLGRLSYEKRLTHFLEMVNDAEATRKTLTVKLEKQNSLIKKIKGKRNILWVLLIIAIVINAVMFYLTNQIVIVNLLYTLLPFVVTFVVYFISQSWTEWTRNSIQKRLKNTGLTAQVQMKEISNIFGPGLKDRLKIIYDSQIESQWSKQSRQQCKLYKCYNQKKSYEELYKTYDEIIDEIKKTNMCDVCLSEGNIPIQKLGLQDLENSIKKFKKAQTGKLTLIQKKQIVNNLLLQYQKMDEKLPHICKKGCCIKQRVLIENAKAKYYDKLKRLNSQLVVQRRS